jgi:stage II sporulation protein D
MQMQSSLKPPSLPASASGRSELSANWLASKQFPFFVFLAICVLILGWTIGIKGTYRSRLSALADQTAADKLDHDVQRAATLALGDRRGTVIVMDPQTGRVRAVVNPELAFEENLPPGSTIKPFTALAALRSGVIDEESRTVCRETYAREEFHTTCSHPRELPPLNPTEAIAYSCNYYFGKVGERLTEANFSSTLNEFGFGKPTGVNTDREAQGALRRNDWHSQNAIGEGDFLRTTPIQLMDAYAALVNGGRLFTPRIAPAGGFVPQLRARLTIENEHRRLILNGMRGAVRYGTAETATLYSLPIYIFGKTGTATQINGYRSQGWFIGFASAVAEDEEGREKNQGAEEKSPLAPERINLAVLVFLTKAHGSEAAEVARPIFDAFARSEISDRRSQTSEESKISDLRSQISDQRSQLTVHLVRENITRALALEDYVRGVVAAEGSMENEPEALKALAVASRTYALKNLGRHVKEGYDFCTTTHCQRYRPADVASSDHVSAAVIEAVESTRGEILDDSENELVDAYFSASCGGATANLAKLWGGHAPPYLRGVHDEYCGSEAHHAWTDVISQKQLLKALQTDPRTNVGERLQDVSVSRTDETGRAELITVAGNRRITIKGWDFKIIVGRALGWNLLKSSRFVISRSGSNFVFHGSGFGHGLGLCQEGAHVMAARGGSYRQILAKYFPSTHIANGNRSPAALDLLWHYELNLNGTAMRRRAVETDVASKHQPVRSIRRTLASEDFRINYPSNIGQRQVEDLLSLLQSSRKSLIARVATAGISARFPSLEIFINETTGDFVGRTGQPAWAAAATKGNRIELQPLELLKRRRILETTLRHELVHTLVDIVGHGRAPRWLAEGLALHLAGEGRLVARYQRQRRMSTDEIEKKLADTTSAASADEMRATYAAAYAEVKRLINTDGEANVWKRLSLEYKL